MSTAPDPAAPATPDPGPATEPAPGTVTDILFVVDMSGSMMPIAADVRGGFNAYIADLKSRPGTYRVTATLFDSAYERRGPAVRCVKLCTAAHLDQVPELTTANYMPGGGTPLLDAIGKTIAEFERAEGAHPGDGRVLLVVQTDGEENSSREFTPGQIRKLITEREATGRWSALFLGADLDAVEQAGSYGFARANTVVVGGTGAATRSTYANLANSTARYAAGASGAEAARGLTPDNGA